MEGDQLSFHREGYQRSTSQLIYCDQLMSGFQGPNIQQCHRKILPLRLEPWTWLTRNQRAWHIPPHQARHSLAWDLCALSYCNEDNQELWELVLQWTLSPLLKTSFCSRGGRTNYPLWHTRGKSKFWDRSRKHSPCWVWMDSWLRIGYPSPSLCLWSNLSRSRCPCWSFSLRILTHPSYLLHDTLFQRSLYL